LRHANLIRHDERYDSQHGAHIMNIAFLGMGLMGSRMSRRLIDASYAVAVWNRRVAACQPLLAHGASLITDWSQLAHMDVIALCLADDTAVSDVSSQFMPLLQEGQIVVDFSSLSVDLTRTLAANAQAKGAYWIDAPVSGGVSGAEQGNLVVFAGGEATIIAQLEPIFATLAQRTTRMGDSGAGQVTKICNQLIVAASSTLIAEAVALAERAGVDAHLLAPALAGGFADSKPFQILAPRMASRQFEPVQWKVRTLKKDLGNALNLAEQLHLMIPVATCAQQQLTTHAHTGQADADLSSLIEHTHPHRCS
jgi:3-hydroxyisobutyrate dehydrogenase